MLKVGIIGAGHISKQHIEAYKKNPECELAAIADLNGDLARQTAETYHIPAYYTDYHKLLEDPQIDAVSIVTPTFTHCDIVIDALKAGKKCLCEKPPARTLAEVERVVKTAEETGAFLMWAFVARFHPETKMLKEYIDAGNLGKIYHAEALRLMRYALISGWFLNKEKSGGGALIDNAIHEIDVAMYLMGYPKVKNVLGFSTDANIDLMGKLKGMGSGYKVFDKNAYDCNVESMASGYVTLENGSCLYTKSGFVSYNLNQEIYIDLLGENGGVRYTRNPEKRINLLTNVNGYLLESSPVIKEKARAFENEINHFVDCCVHDTPCIVEMHQAIELMKIIEGIYRSADSGQPVVY